MRGAVPSTIPVSKRVTRDMFGSLRRALAHLSSLRSSLLPSQSSLRPSIFPPLLQSSRFATAAINVPRSKRFELSVKEGTLPIAALKKFNPVTPGTRHRIVIDKSQLWPGRSEPKLTKRIKSHAGRNHTGQITIRGRCAPKNRRKYRIIENLIALQKNFARLHEPAPFSRNSLVCIQTTSTCP